MSTVAELEAALQARWDRDVLAVYADALQAAGDPRGELIAIDLHIEAHGRSAEVDAARARALEGMLRRHRKSKRWSEWIRFGLLDVRIDTAAPARFGPGMVDSPAQLVAALVGSPVYRYLHRVALVNCASSEHLTALAGRPLPWLQRLALCEAYAPREPLALARLLGAAAPHLHELTVSGPRLVAGPLPASVRRLRLGGSTAIMLGADGAPGVTELALQLRGPDWAALAEVAAGVSSRRFPALTRLDLSDHEPVGVTQVARAEATPGPPALGVLAVLEQLAEPEQLRWVRIPALRTAAQRDAALALLDRCPGLELEVARSYARFADVTAGLAHDRLRLPAPLPWPPSDGFPGSAQLRIKIPDGPTLMFELAKLVPQLERRYDDMPPVARVAWAALWRTLEELPSGSIASGDTRAFSAAALTSALDALPGTEAGSAGDALRAARLDAGATVTVWHTRFAF